MTRYHATVDTPLGWVAVLATEKGIRRVTLPHPKREAALHHLRQKEGDLGHHAPERLAPVLDRLRRYYQGEPVSFTDIPLDFTGRPPFAQAVWTLVRGLPRGHTLTYGEVARQLGRPRAARAVGRAMATNPVPPIVPCHRILGKGGQLTGFGGGLALKAHMLALEGITPYRPDTLVCQEETHRAHRH